ncbi:hypothetical protein FFB58_00145 [Enterobacter sp. MF024]|nr:hypothetical protein FFB58_00145 [Enterobacter sp. MF024]
MALVVIPFTSRAMLFCHNGTGERARAAQSPPPWQPGLPARKSPLRGLFAPSLGLTPSGPAQALSKITPGNFVLSLFLQAFGSGTSLHPCRLCPLGASLRLAPAFRKRFGDFQPDHDVAVDIKPVCTTVIAISSIGSLSSLGRGLG